MYVVLRELYHVCAVCANYIVKKLLIIVDGVARGNALIALGFLLSLSYCHF